MSWVAFLLLLVSTAPMQAEEQLGQRMPARRGEACLVCNKAVGVTDCAYLVDGQRVALHDGNCEKAFLASPSRYMAEMRPNSMLFSFVTSNLSDAWMWLGLYVLVGLVAGGLCANTAVREGRSAPSWFAAGFFFSVAAWLALMLTARQNGPVPVPQGFGKVPLTRDPSRCPQCGHDNHPSAEQCSNCGAQRSPSVRSEVDMTRPS